MTDEERLESRIKEIRRLSQEEGFNDAEIAEELGLSRATVNRTRQAHSIPSANRKNRKDKIYQCSACGQEVLIRRNERKLRYCPTCRESKKKEHDEIRVSCYI